MPHPTATTYRLRLLPLALALIVVTTSAPVELRAPVGWDGTIEVLDIAVNLLLFMPLGLALRRWPWRRLLLSAALLSAVIELGQIWNCDRHPSPGDVAANAAGALLAAWLGRRRWRDATSPAAGIPIGRAAVAVAACAVVALVAAGNLPARSTAVTGWDAEYPLLLGNEMTGDRPWSGTIERLVLVPGTLSHGERRAAAAGDDASFVARSVFVTPAPVVVDGGAGIRLPAEVAEELARSAQSTGALTVVARIVPADTNQTGPARVVSFSTDTRHRNFDLGQQGRRLVFRIRTPLSGDNGTGQQVSSTPVLEAGRPVTVVASYDGRVARMYVDGRLLGRNNFTAAASAAPVLTDEELPAGFAVMGGLLAVIAGFFTAGRGRRAVVAGLLAAGAATLASPAVMPGIAPALAALPWASAVGLVGVVAVGVAGE
jgi:hypothetical protein